MSIHNRKPLKGFLHKRVRSSDLILLEDDSGLCAEGKNRSSIRLSPRFNEMIEVGARDGEKKGMDLGCLGKKMAGLADGVSEESNMG